MDEEEEKGSERRELKNSMINSEKKKIYIYIKELLCKLVVL